MYIEAVPNRNSQPAILLRESYRHEGKVRKRTLCNLSDWSPARVEGLRGAGKGTDWNDYEARYGRAAVAVAIHPQMSETVAPRQAEAQRAISDSMNAEVQRRAVMRGPTRN
jgi:hypothetical protein